MLVKKVSKSVIDKFINDTVIALNGKAGLMNSYFHFVSDNELTTNDIAEIKAQLLSRLSTGAAEKNVLIIARLHNLKAVNPNRFQQFGQALTSMKFPRLSNMEISTKVLKSSEPLDKAYASSLPVKAKIEDIPKSIKIQALPDNMNTDLLLSVISKIAGKKITLQEFIMVYRELKNQ